MERGGGGVGVGGVEEGEGGGQGGQREGVRAATREEEAAE